MKNLTAAEIAQTNNDLGQIDRVAGFIQANYAKWGLPFPVARDILNHLDRCADAHEIEQFGLESFQRRQVEVMKTAKVIQQDGDEAYMSAFQVSHGVVQADGDEPYMNAYRDDQSSAVQSGKSTTGRPLAP